jgi:hypothetical protein
LRECFLSEGEDASSPAFFTATYAGTHSVESVIVYNL